MIADQRLAQPQHDFAEQFLAVARDRIGRMQHEGIFRFDDFLNQHSHRQVRMRDSESTPREISSVIPLRRPDALDCSPCFGPVQRWERRFLPCVAKSGFELRSGIHFQYQRTNF